MIDPHVHLRDWSQSYKETLEHGLSVAYRAGLDGVFEMPNTDPPLISAENIKARINLADSVIDKLKIPVFHGIYAGLTSDAKQVEDAVGVYKELFPRVVGLKMYSAGNMGIVEEDEQMAVYEILAALRYKGVLAVHCEKESLFNAGAYSHNLARPPEAEAGSIEDQVMFANSVGFKGVLHICHVSTPLSLKVIRNARRYPGFTVSCGLTPHHAVLCSELVEEEELLRVNPPLRCREMRDAMFDALLSNGIYWIETDHAPHTLEDKRNGLAGIPGLPYYPRFIKKLRDSEMDELLIDAVTHDMIVTVFGFDENLIPNTRRAGLQSESELEELAKEYEFNPFSALG